MFGWGFNESVISGDKSGGFGGFFELIFIRFLRVD